MTEKTSQSLGRHDLESRIVKRCWENEAFRQEFTADPAGAFVKYLNVAAANLPKIVVHQETAGTWHIVLPARPAGASELSEAELEKVAGGASVPLSLITATVLTGALASGGVTTSAAITIQKGW